MLQTITMLDLRKRIGEVIDRSIYNKDRFLIKRKDKAVAVLVPLEDYQLFIGDDSDIELYTNKRIAELEKEDRLSTKEQALAKKLLTS